jgi:hypothetical protein
LEELEEKVGVINRKILILSRKYNKKISSHPILPLNKQEFLRKKKNQN